MARSNGSPSRELLDWSERASHEIEAEIERLAYIPRAEITPAEGLLHAALLHIIERRETVHDADDSEDVALGEGKL